MFRNEQIYEHPQIILKRRHYGGMVLRHIDQSSAKKIKIIKKPVEDRTEYYQTPYPYNYYNTKYPDITTGESLYDDKSAPEKKTYKRVITDDMKGTDIVEIEADRKNLAVTYTDKDGNVVIKQGGNKAWRTNNPGNLSFSSLEKAKEAGAIGIWEDSEGHKFGIFPSEEAGKKALKEKLQERRFSYRKDGSRRTIENMISEIYAPASDKNDPRGYANFLKNRYGVDVHNKTVEDLDEDEMERLMQGIAAREGNKSGELITKNK